jgi:hypothetical protein
LSANSATYLQKKKQLFTYMPEERIPKLIMDWIPRERRKRGRTRKTWMEGVQEAMTTRNLETDQWRNREEWRLVSGRRRQLFTKTGQIKQNKHARYSNQALT